MQRSLLVFVLLVAPVAASSASAASSATAWLQSHRAPTDDQLGELKNANPDAYAMVKALLSKHTKVVTGLADSERGADVFKRMMTPRHLSAAVPGVAVPYSDPEVAAAQPVMGDQMHYSPNAKADKDESMVDRLLGAVAGLAGPKGKKIALLRQRRHHNEDENPFAKDLAAFGDSQATPAPTLEQVVAVEAPEVKQKVAAAPHENSYLKGLDLSGDMPEVVGAKHAAHRAALESHGNYLASFSFDDSAPAVEAPKPKVVAPKKAKKDNVFLKWLSGVKKAPTPQEAAPAQPAKKAVNSYLANIDFLG